jgi:chromosome partitioning protein
MHLMPANIELSGIEIRLVTEMGRERVMKSYIDSVKDNYDYILIDCMPSLGMMTFNALCAANSVIIPSQPEFLSAKGLEQLLGTIARVKRRMNPELNIDGILLTMTDNRTRLHRGVVSLIRQTYGRNPTVFDTTIPISVKAKESTVEGKSIFEHDGNGKVAEAYEKFTKEVLSGGKEERQRVKSNSDFIR